MIATPAPASAATRPRPSASVVICTYSDERFKHLQLAVESVRAQMVPGDELIVVVDHNPDLLDRVFETLKAKAIPNTEAAGLSGARNSGLRAALGEIVVFLDDDALPRAAWLAELLLPLVDAGVVAVGGDVHASWQTARPQWFAPELDWVVGCSYEGQQRGDVRNPIGANMAFRREALVAVGGFHHGLGRVGKTPLGCEETEIGLRVRAAGLGRCVVVDGAAVDHFVPAERATVAYLARRCYGEGLSKAEVSRRSKVIDLREGIVTPATLAPERRYLLTLARGAALALVVAIADRRPSTVGRAIAIPLGLACTAAGYARGIGGSRRTEPAT